jgi:hypothetical protein
MRYGYCSRLIDVASATRAPIETSRFDQCARRVEINRPLAGTRLASARQVGQTRLMAAPSKQDLAVTVASPIEIHSGYSGFFGFRRALGKGRVETQPMGLYKFDHWANWGRSFRVFPGFIDGLAGFWAVTRFRMPPPIEGAFRATKNELQPSDRSRSDSTMRLRRRGGGSRDDARGIRAR